EKTQLETDKNKLNTDLIALATEFDREKTRADNLQTQITNHQCEAGGCLHTDYGEIQAERTDLTNFIRNKIGVDPTNNANVLVNQLLPDRTKLTDIPDGNYLAKLLYHNNLIHQITNDTTGLPDLIKEVAENEGIDAHGLKFGYKVDTVKLQNHRNNVMRLDDIANLNKTDLDTANQTITNAETYLNLRGKKLVDIMTPTHDNYLELPISLTDDTRAAGLDIFDRNPANGNISGLNLDKIEDYAKSLQRLGLTDFQNATITQKLGTNKLSDIPTGKTLTDLLTATPIAPCAVPCHNATHNDYNTRQTESEEYRRIRTKLNNKTSDSELTNLLNAVPTCSHTDYDTIKQALAAEQAKTKKQKETCDLEKKAAQEQKEKEIINKIITDLSLATERERENVLEA
ncbi:9917_t:CDS:2, partial [Ambispora gerdemannii]